MIESYSFTEFAALEGASLRLTALMENELSPLAKALISESTWFSKTRDLMTTEKFVANFRPMIAKREKNEAMTLVARLRDTQEIVAMSTYQFPSPGFLKIEIGFTWIADSWHRTFVNTEMKSLMLQYAFETMGAKRVEFSVHPKNLKSNNAMIRIGATLEGTLRKWRFLAGRGEGRGAVGDDGNRNMYSIIDDEWPEVSRNIQSKLARE